MKELIKSISKKEKIIVWLMIMALIIIFAIPYVYLWQTAPLGQVWSGLHVLTGGDYNHYFGYIEQVKDGHWLFVDHYTTEEQVRNTLRPEWLVTGLLAKWFHLSNPLAMHLMSSLLIIPFLWILYLLVAYFFQSFKKRLAAWLVILFASGIGVLSFLVSGMQDCYTGIFFQCPMDLWVTEISVFLSAFNSPHFIYSYTLLISVLLFLFLGFDKGRLRYFVYAGLLSNLLIISHTFNLPTIFLVSGFIVLWRIIKNRSLLIRPVLNYVVYLVLTLPALAYVLYLFIFDEVNIAKALQNICLTSGFGLAFLSYGFLFVLAVMGIFFIFKKAKKLPSRFAYLVIWALVQTYLIYSPVVWQRRMTEGLGIVYGLLTVMAIFYIAELVAKKFPKFYEIFKNPSVLFFPFVLFFALSNIYVYANDFLVHGADLNTYYIYYPVEWQETFDWLNENIDQESYVLSHHFMGSYLAANTGLTVFQGHPIETLDYNSKKIKSNWLFSDRGSLADKIEFLVTEKLDYIVVTNYPFSLVGENRMDRTILQNKNYFELKFQAGETAVYKLIKKTLPSSGCNCEEE